MKIVKNLSQIFEAEKGQSFKIGTPKVAPNISTITQWPFDYSWPKKQSSLGTTEEMINFINAATDGDAATVMADIKKATGAIVGISRNESNSEKNKLFGPDTQSVSGFIYLFKPGTIDETKVPAEKKLEPKVNGLFTFVVDAQAKNYIKTASTTQQQTNNTSKPVVKTISLYTDGTKYYDWYTSEGGPSTAFMTETSKIIELFPPAGLNVDTPITSIFWVIIGSLPGELSTDIPQGKADVKAIKYESDLKSAISNVINVAKQYDPDQFSVINLDTLSKDTYNKLAQAILIIGINRGEINIEFNTKSGHATSTKYYRPLMAGLDQARLVKPLAGTNPGASGSGTAAAAAFDGSIIKTEDEVLKIFAGVVKLNPAIFPNADISSLAKVKSYFQTGMNNTSGGSYENMFAAINRYGGFQHGKTYTSSKGFKDFEYTVNGTNSGKFDDALLKVIKSALAASPLK